MLRIIRRLFWFTMGRRLPRKSEYVGFVHGITHVLDEDGSVKWKKHGYWVLSIKNGDRIAQLVGDAGNSAFALGLQAQVLGWQKGGPVPPLGYQSDGDPPPKPRKSKPAPKKKGNVVFLPRKSA